MKNVVDFSCFSSDKRLEMRVFYGLRAGLGLQGKLLIVVGMGGHLRVFWRCCAYFSSLVRAKRTH